MLTGLLLLIAIICVAMLWNEGLWGNAITLVNVFVAALIATNYFEPLAALLDANMGSYTYMWDFLSIWMIFTFTFGMMRVVTDKLCKTKVKFKAPIEHVGRVVFAVAVGYTMMCFTSMTLHLAPLPERAFGGKFHHATKADTAMVIDKNLSNHFGGVLAPDRHWLAAVQSRSAPGGALSRWWGVRTFDPESRFVFKYGARRRQLEEHNKKTGTMRVDVK